MKAERVSFWFRFESCPSGGLPQGHRQGFVHQVCLWTVASRHTSYRMKRVFTDEHCRTVMPIIGTLIRHGFQCPLNPLQLLWQPPPPPSPELDPTGFS